MNPMDLERCIDLAVTTVVEDLKGRSKPVPGSSDIAQVGIISANGDEEVGTQIATAMEKVSKEGVITDEDAKCLQFELGVLEGMRFDRYRQIVVSVESVEVRVDIGSRPII